MGTSAVHDPWRGIDHRDGLDEVRVVEQDRDAIGHFSGERARD